VDAPVSSVGVEVKLLPNQKNSVVAYLFDPEGRSVMTSPVRPGREKAATTLGPAELEPGVWELDLYASYMNTSPASVKVSLQALPLCRTIPEKVSAKLGQGRSPSATITVATSWVHALRGEGKGLVTGNVTEKDQKLKKAEWSRTFSIAPGEAGVTFDLSLSPEDFNKFTDIAVQIVDADGKALVSEGMSYRKGTFELDAPKDAKADAKYTLRVSAATADPDDDSPDWTLHVREIHRYAEPVPVAVKEGKDARLVLYPDHPQDLTLQLKSVPPALPEGAAWLAKITLKDSEHEALQLPLELKLEPGK